MLWVLERTDAMTRLYLSPNYWLNLMIMKIFKENKRIKCVYLDYDRYSMKV